MTEKVIELNDDMRKALDALLSYMRSRPGLYELKLEVRRDGRTEVTGVDSVGHRERTMLVDCDEGCRWREHRPWPR